MEWLGWLQSIDPKLIPPFLIMGLGIYVALRRRTAALEIRVAKVEAETATVAGIHQRLDDLFKLVQQALGMQVQPRPSLHSATAADERQLRNLAKAMLGDSHDR